MLFAVIAGVVCAVGVLFVFMGLSGRAAMDPVQARLSQLGTMQAQTLEQLELQAPLYDRTLRPLAGRLSGIGRRLTSPSKVGRTERRLAMAGNPGNLRTVDFLGLKVLLAGICSVLSVLILGVVFGNFVFGFFAGIGFALLGFVLPDFWLGRHVSDRKKRILRAVPDTLDLLTISVRAGLGFDGALAKVVEKTEGPLAEEFRRVLAEVRMGKARREALRDIVPRTEVVPLTNFIGAIIQAEQLGVSISKVLQVQSEQLRIERRQRAEAEAARAPIKMLFPLVGCIFPSLFIVILGPAIISIMINLRTP